MDTEFTSFAQSQDILATLTHRQPGITGEREPWVREFKCDRVSFDAVLESPVRCSGSSTGSRLLPSLREEYADFAQLGPISFPTPLLETSNGIEFLFGRFFKVFRRLSCSPSIANMKEFMQVLGLLEFAGMEVGMTDEVASSYRTLLSRFLLKLGSLGTAVSALPVNACSQGGGRICVFDSRDNAQIASGWLGSIGGKNMPSDEIMARFVLVAGMGDLLCDTALLPTCKVLLSFIQKYDVRGLVKIRYVII
ncbi:hypothetical protein OSTOST_24071 [Ostertagia ostertagi]